MERQRFLELAAHYLGEYDGKIRHSVKLLTEEQVWWRPNARSNSVGNLIMHICGNLSQWVLAGLGGETDDRRRSLEFSADGVAIREELLGRLAEVVRNCGTVIERLGDGDLGERRRIQGVDTDGMGALFHAVEHMSYHAGQIIFATKQMLGDDRIIDFYPQLRGE
jgi:uncharacterized damage-inducible protein DinB